jgi:hypothetical protein
VYLIFHTRGGWIVVSSFNKKILLLMAGAGVLSILVAFAYLQRYFNMGFMGSEKGSDIPEIDFWAYVSLAFGVCLLLLLAFSRSRQTDKRLILGSTYGIVFLALIQLPPLLWWLLAGTGQPIYWVSAIPHILILWLTVWLCRLFTKQTT